MLLHHLLENSARALPDKPAVWFNDAWKTYGQIQREAAALAAWLRSNGVVPGERVALFLENSFDYISAHFGVLKAGAVEVSLNTELTADSLKKLLDDCEAVVLIAGRKLFRQWAPVLAQVPTLRCIVFDQQPVQPVPSGIKAATQTLSSIFAQGSSTEIETCRGEDDLASLVYTSGSTGKPKGVMLSHRNLASNTCSIAQYLKLLDSDRMLVVLPFHYIYGRSLLYSHFLTRGSILLDNRFAFPVTVLNTLQQLEATAFAGVPSTFSILLNKTDLRKRKFPHLRLITQAGGGMAPAIQKDVAQVFEPAELFIMYGTTEAAPRLSYLEPALLPRKWGSIGCAIPGVELAVMDQRGCKVPRGVEGEIAARGPNIMLGYWKDPQGTAEVIRDGYYYTGDLGYEDDDGCIFLTGRARDMIKAGGNRISAREIEDVILELNGVVEAAVIGIPDEILGEAPKAFVVSSTVSEDVLRRHIGARLPTFKHPRWFEFRQSLPKNQAGKILKSALRAELSSVTLNT
jgi:long-chain acyl-CoA synthetase